MGEARRKAQLQSARPWAKGALKIEANGVKCFEWQGTRTDAVTLQKEYLRLVDRVGLTAQSYARRAAGYLMAFGPPKAGEPRLMPTGFGEPWASADVALHDMAVLWLVLREHIPNTGSKVEDIFVGKELVAMFVGEREQILTETEREQRGTSFTGDEFQMVVAVANNDYRLDPEAAVSMNEGELLRLATGACPDGFGDRSILVPRVPLDAREADAMLRLLTIVADATMPGADVITYAGYTQDELRRGKPAVLIGN